MVERKWKFECDKRKNKKEISNEKLINRLRKLINGWWGIVIELRKLAW